MQFKGSYWPKLRKIWLDWINIKVPTLKPFGYYSVEMKILFLAPFFSTKNPQILNFSIKRPYVKNFGRATINKVDKPKIQNQPINLHLLVA